MLRKFNLLKKKKKSWEEFLNFDYSIFMAVISEEAKVFALDVQTLNVNLLLTLQNSGIQMQKHSFIWTLRKCLLIYVSLFHLMLYVCPSAVQKAGFFKDLKQHG